MIKSDELKNRHLFKKQIEATMEKYKIIGLQAAVVYKENLIWADSYGSRNLETNEPVTEKTMFRIASISKLFTATAIMQLVEKQLITLEQDISEYLGFQVKNPNYPTANITLRHILTHTSSLNSDDESNSVYAKFIKDGHNDLTLGLKELLVEDGKYYSNKIWGNWPPGSQSDWVYSNIGAIICGAIIEKVSGLRFDQYIQQFIFFPLNMKNVAFSYSNIRNANELANLYELNHETKEYQLTIDDKGKKEYPINFFEKYIPGTHGGLFEPQGGLRTTAIELSKFLRAHMLNGRFNHEQILKPDTSLQMKTKQWSRIEKNHFFSKMGLGFHISHDFLTNYDEMIGHAGEAYGLISNLYWNEEEQFGIIFIINGCQFDSESKSRFEVEKELAEIIYSNTIQKIL